jgi:hypothetical protein
MDSIATQTDNEPYLTPPSTPVAQMPPILAPRTAVSVGPSSPIEIRFEEWVQEADNYEPICSSCNQRHIEVGPAYYSAVPSAQQLEDLLIQEISSISTATTLSRSDSEDN